MSETIRRQFLVEVTAARDPARRQVTSRDEVRPAAGLLGAQGLPPAGALRDRTGSPQNPHRTRTLISLVVRCRKGLLVGVTARTGAPASGVEVCPLLAGATVEAGYWVLGEDARDGDRGSRRRDGRRGPRSERSPAHSSGWGKSGGWRPLAKRLRPAAWLHRKRMEGSAGSGGGLGCRAYARGSTCSGSLNEFPIGSRPHASLEIASLHFLAPRGGTDDRSHGESTQ